MRWQPTTDRCSECGFDWRVAREDAVRIVLRGPSEVAELLRQTRAPRAQVGDAWSASMYVWHLVDVLRIGTERLLTVMLDPQCGIPCWDENALAADRRYAQLSPVVGAEVLHTAARGWQAAAEAVSDDAEVDHPQFGTLGAVALIRRNAHEVHHHLGDIRRRSQVP